MVAEEQRTERTRRGDMQEPESDDSDTMNKTAVPPPAYSGPIPPRMEMNLLLREMGRSLQSLVQERKAKTEEIIKALDPTPDQEAKIRTIIRQVGEKSGLSPKVEARGELMRQILQVLTPEQRIKARKALAER